MAEMAALSGNCRTFPSIRPCFIRTFRHLATANATMKQLRPSRHLDRAHLQAALISVTLGVALATAAHASPSAPLGSSRPTTADDAASRRAAGSALVSRYGSPRTEELIARIARLERDDGRSSKVPTSKLEDAELELYERAMRDLLKKGLRIPSKNGVTAARREALETIQGLESPLELRAAMRVLEGEGMDGNLVRGELDVRKALFAALARNTAIGHPALVRYAIVEDDAVARIAQDLLPEELSPQALAVVESGLRSSRELHINRAAMIASAHTAAALIPALIDAQFEERSSEGRGDEAWIAIGRRTAYIAGYVPVLGDGSGALQPIPGIVYEGSLLRIMESAVFIYRTEVHRSLAMVIERTTGQPAPPLGFDRDRWLAWYQRDYPFLVQAFAEEASERAAAASDTVTVPARSDA